MKHDIHFVMDHHGCGEARARGVCGATQVYYDCGAGSSSNLDPACVEEILPQKTRKIRGVLIESE
jgi:hypothetical protein